MPYKQAGGWWQLGAMLVEMLSGAPPFGGARSADDSTVLDAVRSRRVDDPVGCLRGASDAAMALARALLAHEPCERPGGSEVLSHAFFGDGGAEAVIAAAPPAEALRIARTLVSDAVIKDGATAALAAEGGVLRMLGLRAAELKAADTQFISGSDQ